MRTLLEQSRAYAELGMLDEARALADECVSPGGDYDVIEGWRVRLAYKSADFARAATLGCNLFARERQLATDREYAALALHHCGQPRKAAALLLELGELGFSSLQNYLTACFLAADGEQDWAMRLLLKSLPYYRDDQGKTWLDGDLKMLWQILARGQFSLETAHLLVEHECDILRAWQSRRDTKWELDPKNYDDLPVDLKCAVRFDAKEEAYVLDYSKAPACSQLAGRFERWVRDEVAANQDYFDQARRIAWKRVLDAQPQYARAAWRRGDLSAATEHVTWAVEKNADRISDFFDSAELAPLIDETWSMLESDLAFFSKLARVRVLSSTAPEEALEILGTLPSEWSGHPLLLRHHANCLAAKGSHDAALACHLRTCFHSPHDAMSFIHAAQLARMRDYKELFALIEAHAPESVKNYTAWEAMTTVCAGGMRPYRDPVREFRGQPDLGGLLITEENESPRSRTAAGLR